MRNRFPFFERNPEITYMDTAATSQTLDTVIEDMQTFYLDHKSNAHRSGHSMGAWIDNQYQRAKSLIGKWLRIENVHDRLVFTSGASQSLSDAVNIIHEKVPSVIAFVPIDFHHSLYLPMKTLGWQIEFVEITNGVIDQIDLNIKLSRYPLSQKVIAFSAVSNVLGKLNDLLSIKKIAAEHNAWTILDASQLLTKRDLSIDGFDFVAWGWHKLYGPSGLGCLLLSSRWAAYDPVRPGGGSVINVTTHDIEFQTKAAKFESGTLNLAAISSIPNLVSWLIDNKDRMIQHDIDLTISANHLAKHSICNSDTSLISLDIPNGATEDYVMLLDADGICVRGGKLCAQPLVDSKSLKRSALRISWGAYTTVNELKKTFSAIGEICERI